MTHFKIGDKVKCIQYFAEYGDTEPASMEDLEENQEKLYYLITEEVPLTIREIETDHLDSDNTSPFHCETEDGQEHAFMEEEIELYITKVDSWRKRLAQ